MNQFVSRAGEKLQFALKSFDVFVKDLVCADFGASTGGFTDCMLQNGAEKVYAIETGYGTIDWKIRNDKRVVVMERTNAMHVVLPEKMDFISIDVSWTKQKLIIPNALANLEDGGVIISLIKPHYEAEAKFVHRGKLMEDRIDEAIKSVKGSIEDVGGKVIGVVESPIVGKKGENKEFLALINKV